MQTNSRWSVIIEFFRRDGWRKLVAVFLSLLLYMSIAPRTGNKVEKSFHNVPVHIELPADIALKNQEQRTVTFVLKGLQKDLDEIDPKNLNIRATVHRDRISENSPYLLRLRFSDVSSLPSGVKISAISPQELTLDLEQLFSKTVPIKARFSADEKTKNNYAVINTSFHPPEITVKGAASSLNLISEIYTDPIPLDGASEDFEYSCSLQMLPGVTYSYSEIKALVKVVPIKNERFISVPIQISQSAENTRKFKVSDPSPGSISVILEGPQYTVQLLRPGKDITASINLNGIEKPGKYERDITVNINSQDENIKIASYEPKTATITVEQNSSPAPQE